MPEEESIRSKTRRSLVYFVHPDDDIPMNVPLLYKDPALNEDELIPAKTITALDYLLQKFSTSY